MNAFLDSLTVEALLACALEKGDSNKILSERFKDESRRLAAIG